MKPWVKMFITISVSVLLVFSGCLLSYYVGTRKGRRIAVDFNNIDMLVEIDKYEPRYAFLPKYLDMYICLICDKIKLDSDRAVAQLMVENAEFNPDAIHRNKNGTLDVGEFQLNDYYLWTTFIPRYWFDNVEFDPFNWKHNTYIALHHMKYLEDKLKIEDDAIMAYNCGEGNVMNGTIPESTKVYLAKVKNNLYLLRGEK